MALFRSIPAVFFLLAGMVGSNTARAEESSIRGLLTLDNSGAMRRGHRLQRALFWVMALSTQLVLVPGCKKSNSASRDRAHVLVVGIDTSPSIRAVDHCAEVGARLRATLGASDEAKIDLLLLATGDEAEPVTVLPWTRIAKSDDRLYGDPEAEAQEQDKLLRDVLTPCRARMKTSLRSPIFKLVKRGAEAIRAHCAELERDGEGCAPRPVLAIHSDFQETEEAALLPLLVSPKGKTIEAFLPTIDVRNLDVRACGYASTDVRTGTIDVVAVWKRVLGDAATFAPVCPVLEDAGRPAQVGR